MLAGLYEFPSMEGHQTKKAVLEYMKEQGLEVLRIQKMESSKHIFSHKEWHMEAYFIKVDELSAHGEILEKEKWIPVERKKAEERDGGMGEREATEGEEKQKRATCLNSEGEEVGWRANRNNRGRRMSGKKS